MKRSKKVDEDDEKWNSLLKNLADPPANILFDMHLDEHKLAKGSFF